MSRQIVDKIAKTYCGEVQVGPNQWLSAKRVLFDPTHRNAPTETLFTLHDKQTRVSIELAVYSSGKWSMCYPSTSSTFFKLMKAHNKFINTMLKLTQTEDELPATWKVQWTCLKRRFSFESLKIKRKVKHLTK